MKIHHLVQKVLWGETYRQMNNADTLT